ncbi:hypothetical protein SMICM304S_04333 [Streptomyces microflavus]
MPGDARIARVRGVRNGVAYVLEGSAGVCVCVVGLVCQVCHRPPHHGMPVVDGFVGGQIGGGVRGLLDQFHGPGAYEAADRRSIDFRSTAYSCSARGLRYRTISSFSAWRKASTSSSRVSNAHIQRTSPAVSSQK